MILQQNRFVPAVIKYAKSLADSVNAIKAAGIEEVSVETELLAETSALLKETQVALKNLIDTDAKACGMEDGAAQAAFYHDEVMKAMSELRAPVDKLEMIVDKEMWPMPSYGDLMFEV